MVKEIREAGTDRREIWKQVHSMSEEFGLQAPRKRKGRYTTQGQFKRQQLK